MHSLYTVGAVVRIDRDKDEGGKDMIINRKELLRVVEDHGGYTVLKCNLCGGSGWWNDITHEDECPLKDETVKRVKVTEA